MTLAMAALAICCAAIGLLPALLAPAIEGVAAQWFPGRTLPALAALAPLPMLTPFAVALLAGAGLLMLALGAGRRRGAEPTWDCGFALPTPRMQYTGSSFAQWLVVLWKWVLLPVAHRAAPTGLFPAGAGFASHVPDPVLDRGVLPALRGAAWVFSWLRPLQRGDANAYLLYVFAALILLLILR
jgi:hydrogenase-4 component B